MNTNAALTQCPEYIYTGHWFIAYSNTLMPGLFIEGLSFSIPYCMFCTLQTMFYCLAFNYLFNALELAAVLASEYMAFYLFAH